MRRVIYILLFVILANCSGVSADSQDLFEKPEDRDIHARSMKWYNQAKFGMFMHFGLYSINHEFCWTRLRDYMPKGQDDSYRKLVEQFDPQKFDADAIVTMAKESGFRWIVITAKHHDGFAIYNSKVDPFSLGATPFGKGGRDILKELAQACRKHGMKLGFYYSHYQDWDHPGGGTADLQYADLKKRPYENYINDKAMGQVRELLSEYGDVCVLWYDTPMHLGQEDSLKFRKLTRQLSPQTIIGGRIDDMNGDFWSIPDNRVPAIPFGEPWETCMTANGSWSYSPKKTRPVAEMVRHLVDIVSRGGNFLLNTGPKPDGTLNPEDVKAFRAVGKWLKVNGDSIYGTDMNPFHNGQYICTRKANKLYFHFFDWPKQRSLTITSLKNKPIKAYMLADKQQSLLKLDQGADKITVQLPAAAVDEFDSVLVLELDGPPEVENVYPTGDKNGKLIITSEQITIVHSMFSKFNKAKQAVEIDNTRRAWLNGYFKILKAGSYTLAFTVASPDNLAGQQFYFKSNDQLHKIRLADSASGGAYKKLLSDKPLEFEKPGVYYFTIRPVKWHLRKTEDSYLLKNIILEPKK
jgi:alpha-L-fucosidase